MRSGHRQEWVCLVPGWRAGWGRRPAGVRLWSGRVSSSQRSSCHPQTDESPAVWPETPHSHSAPEHTREHTCLHHRFTPDHRAAFWEIDSYVITGAHACTVILKPHNSSSFKHCCAEELDREDTVSQSWEKQTRNMKQKSKLYTTCPLHCTPESLKHTQTEENINTLLDTHTWSRNNNNASLLVMNRNHWIPLNGVTGHCRRKDKCSVKCTEQT